MRSSYFVDLIRFDFDFDFDSIDVALQVANCWDCERRECYLSIYLYLSIQFDVNVNVIDSHHSLFFHQSISHFIFSHSTGIGTTVHIIVGLRIALSHPLITYAASCLFLSVQYR